MTTIPHDREAGPPDSPDPIAAALLAVMASAEGDAADAERHLLAAQRQSQAGVRRQRQVLEIAKLFVDGSTERAAGLALIHVAEFPNDTELLDRMTGGHSGTR
jgi:hypothetical protein